MYLHLSKLITRGSFDEVLPQNWEISSDWIFNQIFINSEYTENRLILNDISDSNTLVKQETMHVNGKSGCKGSR